MMCQYSQICGGCKYRDLPLSEYQAQKEQKFLRLLEPLNAKFAPTIFVEDGQRRRVNLSFEFRKKELVLGFYQEKSHQIINLQTCSNLTERLNLALPKIRAFLLDICSTPIEIRNKKKVEIRQISKGEIFVLEAHNGLVLSVKIEAEINLTHKLIISDFIATNPDFVSVAIDDYVVCASSPIIKNSGFDVLVESTSFLQVSQSSEQALISTVLKYLGEPKGKIADLFCGLGTFSYPLKNAKVTAVDSSDSALSLFQQSINKNMITNIEILKKNLFKYPLNAIELKNFEAIIFDPPFSGAFAQVQEIAKIEDKIKKIVAISCNPYSFIKDADVLIRGGYSLSEITLIDQFIYSDHIELVALFEGGQE